MRTKLFLLAVILALALPLAAAPPIDVRKGWTPNYSLAVDNEQFINVNRILMFVTNHGNFGRDLTDRFGQDAGTFYPYTSIEAIEDGSHNDYVLYASGLWIGGKVEGDIRVAVAEYEDEYVPGPMKDSTFMEDRPEFKVYKLYSDSLESNPNADYLNWPVNQGAPYKVVDGDTVPDMIGDQMLWAVFNDADPAQHGNNSGETDPLGIEVRQTTFGWDRQGALGNIIFIRLQIFNRGPNTIQDCYFSLWADPDLGGYTDDLVGCDTILSIGYVYNATNQDEQYGNRPPCLGYDFFQGPLVATGNPADSGRMWGQKWGGYRNLGMVSFNKYINGTDPNDFNETYNYMQGLSASGDPYVYENDTLLYMHSGDPVTGAGDLDVDPADRRWMQSTGPITFAPGDSTEIIAAIIVGQGNDRLNSITIMKELDQFAQEIYNTDFNPPQAPTKPNVRVGQLPGEIALYWDDISEKQQGDFPFIGYTVWQGPSEAGPCTELATFTTLTYAYAYQVDPAMAPWIEGLGALVDSVKDSYSGLVVPWIRRKLNDGLQYNYNIKEDHLRGGPLRDVTTYYFRVTAFSFANWYNKYPDQPDSLKRVPNADRLLESQVVLPVVPQAYRAGLRVDYGAEDILPVNHVSGASDITIQPIVLNPFLLTGDSYLIWFEDTGTDTVWYLKNTTRDTVLVAAESDMSGTAVQLPTEALQLVVNMAAGVVAIDEIAGAEGPIDPPDNVMYSLNSTQDWYVDTDVSQEWDRLNYRGHLGTYDWEMRFTEQGSQAYDWNTELLLPDRVPFEMWNVGKGTPDDPSDDVRIQIALLDDDTSGTWSYGDRIYCSEREYYEPLPDAMEYTWDDDFRIGRIKIMDYSGATTAPATGTIIRFTTAKLVTPADTFTFVATRPAEVASQQALDGIRVVPNPFYLYGPYDTEVGNYQIKFHGLPAKCTITIYNLAGEFITEIVKNDPTTSIATWNARTRYDLPVASGIYLWVVDAPGFGQKIGKMAVFTETEVLQQY